MIRIPSFGFMILLIFLSGCSKDENVPVDDNMELDEAFLTEEILLNYTLNGNYSFRSDTEDNPRIVWITSMGGALINEPMSVSNGATLRILRWSDFADKTFVLNELTKAIAENGTTYTDIYSTVISDKIFIRSEKMPHKKVKIGSLTLTFSGFNENQSIKFRKNYSSALNYNSSEEHEIDLLDTDIYALAYFIDENNKLNYGYFDNFEDGKVIDVSLDSFDTIEGIPYSTSIPYHGFSPLVRGTNNLEEFPSTDLHILPGIGLEDDSRLLYHPTSFDHLLTSFFINVTEGNRRQINFGYVDNKPDAGVLTLPDTEISVNNSKLESLDVQVIGQTTYSKVVAFAVVDNNDFYSWTIVAPSSEEVVFPEIPQSVSSQFSVNRETFESGGTEFSSYYYDHLDYDGYIQRKFSDESKSLFYGGNSYSSLRIF